MQFVEYPIKSIYQNPHAIVFLAKKPQIFESSFDFIASFIDFCILFGMFKDIAKRVDIAFFGSGLVVEDFWCHPKQATQQFILDRISYTPLFSPSFNKPVFANP